MLVRIGYRQRNVVEFEHNKKYNSLLKDTNYLEIIKRVVSQYATIKGNPDFFNQVPQELLQQFLSDQTPESLQMPCLLTFKYLAFMND